MTTPGGDAPDGAWVLGSGYGQDVTEQSFNAAMRAQNTDRGYREGHNLMQGLLGTIVGWIATGISDLVSAFFGNYTGNNQEIIAYQSAQMELNDRLDLLDDVSGYAQCFAPTNFSFSRRTNAGDPKSGYLVPFSQRIGPQKHATVLSGGIQIDQPGTWRIDCKIVMGRGATVLVGHLPFTFFDIQVWGKDGDPNSIISRATSLFELRYNGVTHSWSSTVVLPPEYFVGDAKPIVQVRGWHNFSSNVGAPGGSSASMLSVNRWDLRTDGPPNPDPDVDDL